MLCYVLKYLAHTQQLILLLLLILTGYITKTEWKKRDLFCQTTAEIEEVHLEYCCFVLS